MLTKTGRLLAAFLLIVGTAALSPFVLQSFWGWFVVPLGVKAVGYWQTAGLTMLVRLATKDLKPGKSATDEEKEKVLYNASISFCALLLVWGTGWLLSP